MRERERGSERTLRIGEREQSIEFEPKRRNNGLRKLLLEKFSRLAGNYENYRHRLDYVCHLYNILV
jgi:hypothetical protein